MCVYQKETVIQVDRLFVVIVPSSHTRDFPAHLPKTTADPHPHPPSSTISLLPTMRQDFVW